MTENVPSNITRNHRAPRGNVPSAHFIEYLPRESNLTASSIHTNEGVPHIRIRSKTHFQGQRMHSPTFPNPPTLAASLNDKRVREFVRLEPGPSHPREELHRSQRARALRVRSYDRVPSENRRSAGQVVEGRCGERERDRARAVDEPRGQVRVAAEGGLEEQREELEEVGGGPRPLEGGGDLAGAHPRSAKLSDRPASMRGWLQWRLEVVVRTTQVDRRPCVIRCISCRPRKRKPILSYKSN